MKMQKSDIVKERKDPSRTRCIECDALIRRVCTSCSGDYGRMVDLETENNYLRADLAETEAELAALRGQLAEIIEVLRKELPSKKWGWSDE